MKNRDSLFQLIKSLTKNEKGYFKKHVSGIAGKNANAYLKLFDAFAKQDTCDDEKIIKTVESSVLGKQNLAVTKHYLYEVIMKSLRAYYGKPSTDSMLKEMIRNAEILFYIKDRKEDSREILQKALNIAAKYERFLVQLEIHNFLYTVDLSLNMDNREYAATTAEAYKKQIFILDKYRDYVELRTLFSRQRILIGNTSDKLAKDQEELKSILNNPIINKKVIRSYKNGLLYYSIMSNIFANGLYQPEKSYELNKSLITFMESDEIQLNEDLSHYAMALNNLMTDQMHLGKYEEMKETLEKIRTRYQAYEFEFIRLNAFSAAASTELAYYAATGQPEAAMPLIKDIEVTIMPDEKIINRNYKIELILGISIIYLLAKNYTKARSWLNKNLNDTSPERNDIKAFSQILNLIIAYELKDYNYLEHLVSKYKRNLKACGTYFNFERPVVDFMSKAIVVSSEEKNNNNLIKLESDLENSKNARDEYMYCYFNIPRWVKNKIRK
jgi:hypothetical protein